MMADSSSWVHGTISRCRARQDGAGYFSLWKELLAASQPMTVQSFEKRGARDEHITKHQWPPEHCKAGPLIMRARSVTAREIAHNQVGYIVLSHGRVFQEQQGDMSAHTEHPVRKAAASSIGTVLHLSLIHI